jgi:hypothetical protein
MSGPPSSVSWQFEPGRVELEQIDNEWSSSGGWAWWDEPDDGCLDGTIITFSLDPSVTEPVIVEWSLEGAVVSFESRVKDLELTLLFEEL